jgi:hypothetical protein
MHSILMQGQVSGMQAQSQRYISVEKFGLGRPAIECPADISLCAAPPFAGLGGVLVPLIILEAISLLSVRVSQESFEEFKRQRGDWLYTSRLEMAAVSRAAPPRLWFRVRVKG